MGTSEHTKGKAMKLWILTVVTTVTAIASFGLICTAQSVQEGHSKSRQITNDPAYLRKRAEVRRLAQEGHQAFLRREYDNAEDYLRSTLKIDPYYYPAAVDLGRTLERIGKVKEAVEVYRTVLRPVPGVSVSTLQHDSGLLMRYAVLCAKTNQWHESRLAANEAISYSEVAGALMTIPNGVKPQLASLQALSLLFDGIQATKNGDETANRKALDLFNAALDLSPNLAAASYQKGVALENLGRHPQAESAYREAMRHGNDAVKRLSAEKMPPTQPQ